MFIKSFKHDIICIIDDNNLIHNINNYSITINSSDLDRRLADKMATNLWCYFTLRMREHPWHVSIRLANICSILSSINIYPLLNTVLKTANHRDQVWTTSFGNKINNNLCTLLVWHVVALLYM